MMFLLNLLLLFSVRLVEWCWDNWALRPRGPRIGGPVCFASWAVAPWPFRAAAPTVKYHVVVGNTQVNGARDFGFEGWLVVMRLIRGFEVAVIWVGLFINCVL